jgi:hypothetical protein
MNQYRTEGLGWLSAVFAVLGAGVVLANLLDIEVLPLNILNALPLVFGLVLLAAGVVLLLTGFFAGRRRP